MPKTFAAIAVAATVVVGSIASPTVANAHCDGCGVAAGVLGGLAAGAIIGSAVAGPHAYYGPGTYYGPDPYYYGPPPAYVGPECYWTRRRVWIEGWGWRVRRVRVCD